MLLPVQWLSDKLVWQQANDPDFTYKIADFYTKFQFKNIVAEIGDYVLISNADAAEPDTIEGCDVAQITKLYESHDKDLQDRFRAHVQWFCKPHDVPKQSLTGTDINITDEIEVVEDLRPYDRDVSIETFFKKCKVIKMPTTAIITQFTKPLSTAEPIFYCRYQLIMLTKRKCALVPVLADERKDFEINPNILKTPKKKIESCSATPTKRKHTPSTKEGESWKIKIVNSSKLTLMRDITNSINKDLEHVENNVKNLNLDNDQTLNKHDKSDALCTPSKRRHYKTHNENVDTPKSGHKRSPKRRNNTPVKFSDSEDDFVLKTPKKSRKSLFKDEATPSIARRKTAVKMKEGALQIARESLHVSAIPLSLPCREEEFNNIYTFLNRKISENDGGCMYISGVPGTGKTATVMEIIRCLKKKVTLNDLPKFDFIEINGMRLTEPRQAYVQIYKQLTGKTVAWEQACKLLETRFTKPAPKRCTTVLLVDELDVLCNRRQDVLYNLLDWPSKSVARLVVVAIANTMDLPERLLMGRVASRLGLTRLTFQPYTFMQLESIVTARLSDTGAFNPDAVQLVARKVAAVSGDARRALDICRRAVELAELTEKANGTAEQVSLSHVNQALTEMIANPKVQAIKSCSKMEQLFLQAIAAEVQRTGIEECNFNMIYKQMETICAFVKLKTPTVTNALSICCRLSSSRLIISDNSRNDIHQKILLNVSTDDVHYSTQNLLN